jgi:tRNA(Ile)-lysidine synthase
MKVSVPNGRYVLAVSGGVDSMVLLDMLASQPGIGLVVAHFNHGIRPGSSKDQELVAETAKKYGLNFEVGYGKLGANASEAQARAARYEFLNGVKSRHAADKIITAHHQDDLIETAILNILRGTGPKGLTAIGQNRDIVRPLLNLTKPQLRKYAKDKQLKWREDPTNQDPKYLRNYIRRQLMPKLTPTLRRELLQNIDKIAQSSEERTRLLKNISSQVKTKKIIDRQAFTMLPLSIERELMAYWLDQQGTADIDRKTVERLAMAIKTAPAGTRHNVRGLTRLFVSNKFAYFDTPVG